MFCQNCGRQIPDHAKFCNHCGAAQGVQEDTLSQNTKQNERSSAQSQQQHIQQPYASNRQRAASKSSIRENIKTVLAVAAILVVAAIIVYKQISDMQPTANQSSGTFSKDTYQESKEPKGMDEETFPFYALLTDKKKVVYEEALACIKDGKEGFIPSCEFSEAASLSDLEAERFFHDYICKNVTYQSGTYDQNIYSTFVENKTVCSGYTRALQYLMMKRGVPCYYCVGTLYSVEKQDWVYHSWNIIKLNGNYYNCDLTWDDFYNEVNRYPSYISYEHFNTSDAQYIVDGENNLGRIRTEYGILLPACNADDMNYKALYGTEWEYDVIEQLELDGTYMIDSVESYFDFLYTQTISRGIGNHSLTFIIKGSNTIERIGNLSNDEYVYNLIDPVADYLGRSGWSGINWQSQYYPLWSYDEYFYMECQLDFY